MSDSQNLMLLRGVGELWGAYPMPSVISDVAIVRPMSVLVSDGGAVAPEARKVPAWWSALLSWGRKR